MALSDHSARDAAPRTLHGRLAEELLGRIRSGEWPVGATLPSENELSQAAGVSRHTLRHTLRTLEARGFIERRQGAPSKVISSTEPRIFSQDFNSIKELLRYPRNTYRENRVERAIECDRALQPVLKAPVGSSWFHIGAVRREETSGLALAWTDIYIQHRFARVVKTPNHNREMVFEQIERLFGVAIDRAEVEVQASLIGKQHAALLDAPAGSACLVVTRRYFDKQGHPFEVTVTRHPENRFSFGLELKSHSRVAA
ncbi:MAG TPA: GntR family transcriptional regulator [Burkholderiales bacterium]|nr:GntR family transcriptional regulator [Burkholderiales bacterium]